MSPAMLLLYGPFVIRTKTCQWGASLESTSMRQGADGEQVGGPLLGVGGEGVVPLESRDADVGAGGVVGVEGGLLVGGQAGGAAGGGARGAGAAEEVGMVVAATSSSTGATTGVGVTAGAEVAAGTPVGAGTVTVEVTAPQLPP
ncbi:hypothetical protein Ct61P_00497 [Colletotrichum tofieldiae]|nr:hypothetical protein Ct61P_00497 [Colletotrichum tofieldiae]